MTREVEKLIEIAELQLKKSAVILDLLKTDPTHAGIAAAQAAELRFDNLIRQKRLGRDGRRMGPVIIDECAAFTKEDWDKLGENLLKGRGILKR